MGQPAESDRTPAALRELLANGQVQWSRHAPSPTARRAPSWSLGALQGRVVELVGRGPSALLTVAAELVLEAQRAREPVVWVTHPRAPVFPPDLAGNGVDLAALPIVRVAGTAAVLQAADTLLRSGAFGLVVLDPVTADEGRGGVPLGVQVRLAGLAQRHDAAVLWLTTAESWGERVAASSRPRVRRWSPSRRPRSLFDGDGVARGAQVGEDGGRTDTVEPGPLPTALGAPVSLRAESLREPLGDGRYACVLRVAKDKQSAGGGGWEHRVTYRGAVGLC